MNNKNNNIKNSSLIVANWKMNGSKTKIREDLQCYVKNKDTNTENIIFAVPYLYLALMQQAMWTTNAQYKIASQDISRFSGYGAYTGEVSSSMLPELDVTYSIIGHSERRNLCGDTDEIIAQKLHNLLSNQITPIYCIGESLTMRKSGEYTEFLLKQLDVFLEVFSKTQVVTQISQTSQAAAPTQSATSDIIIAYEPIWSIGTGIIPEIEQIEEIMNLIHAFVQKKLGHVKIAALYGGSVTSKNITEILQIPSVNGVLVGGASLNVDEFIQICHKAQL